MRKANVYERLSPPHQRLGGHGPYGAVVVRLVSFNTPGRASSIGRDSLGEGVGGSGVSSLDDLLGVALVELHELGQIELGLLEHLHLLDEHVLEGEDLGAVLRDLLDDGVGQAKIIYYLLTLLTQERSETRHLQILEEIFEG